MGAIRRAALYGVVFATGLVAGVLLRSPLARLHQPWLERDPKSAPERERQILGEIIEGGYGSAERFAAGSPPLSRSYFDKLRTELETPRGQSSWFYMRLIEELGKSDRLEDAGYLLMLAVSDERPWLARRARDSADRVAQRVADAKTKSE